jgi:hypothetical protein
VADVSVHGDKARNVTAMKKPSSTQALFAVVLALAFACALFWAYRNGPGNPARRPDALIEAELLTATPLGTNIADVENYIQERWPKEGVVGGGRVDFLGVRILSVGVEYGEYVDFPRSIFTTEVLVYYRFSLGGRLTKIEVLRRCVVP